MFAPKSLKHEIGALMADGLAFQKEGFSRRWPPIGAGRQPLYAIYEKGIERDTTIA